MMDEKELGELGLGILLDISELKPIMKRLPELVQTYLYFLCPHCKEVVLIPMRDEESIQHCEDIKPLIELRKKIPTPVGGAVMNSRIAECIHCEKSIWCSDEYTVLIHGAPPLVKAKPATFEDIAKSVVKSTTKGLSVEEEQEEVNQHIKYLKDKYEVDTEKPLDEEYTELKTDGLPRGSALVKKLTGSDDITAVLRSEKEDTE